MAGNQLRFNEAIERARTQFRNEKWVDAHQAYRRALEEFPNDMTALVGYALSLFNADEWDKAQEVYQRLIQVAPEDPGHYDKMGAILEHKKSGSQAAGFYLKAAERYRAHGLNDQAITALENAVRAEPLTDRAWADLFKHYQTTGQIDKAVTAALWLAHIYQTERPQWAIEICRQIQRSTPLEPRLAQAMSMLQSGRQIPTPPQLEALVQEQLPEDLSGEGREMTLGSLTEITRQRALEELAESIFAEEQPAAQGLPPEEVNRLISKAVSDQTQGELESAIQAYETLAQAGINMPSVYFNLGMLYKEQMRFDLAIRQFERSLTDAEYLLGSHFALGECHQAQGNFKKALTHFLEAIKIVDMTTVQREQVDDLFRVYEGLAQNLVNTGEPERIQQLSNSLVDFLSQRGWEDELGKARKRLDGLARSGIVLSLAEIISLPGSEEILRSVAMAQEYLRRKKFHMALEELFYTINKAPSYLPLHHLLASFFLESGNLEGALDKFRMIARTYEIRGQTPQSLATYQQILELSPLDITIHQRMIELLIQRGQIDDALSQHLQLADAYYQLAQPERAREIYDAALHLAPRGTQQQNWQVRILHRRADLDMQRLDWQTAIKDYEEIIRAAPDDERAHLALLQLYPRTGRAQLGIATLDRLIKRLLDTQKAEKASAILENLCQEEPENLPLRGRIAQFYLNIGRRDKAMEHLDVLGDLQINAGQTEAASKTIEAILALGPSDYQGYADLYKELTGREPPPPK